MKKFFLIIITIILISVVGLQSQQEKGQKKELEEEKQKENGIHFGGKVGWVNHTETSYDNESDSRGGLGFGLWFEYPLSQYFIIREQVGRSSFSFKETEYMEGYLFDLSFSLSDFSWISYLMVSLPLGETGASSYLGAGFGVHFMGMKAVVTEQTWGSSITESESATNLGFDLIGGTSIPAGNVGLVFEIGYNFVKVPNDWYRSYNEFCIMGGLEF